MPFIKITDQLGVSIEAQLAPASAWLRYSRDLSGMVLNGATISQLQSLKLNDPLVFSLQPTLTFQQPIRLGQDCPQLTISAEAGVSFRVITPSPGCTELFSPDEYGDNIEIPAGTCYVVIGLSATASAGVQAGSAALQFGFNADGGFEIEACCPFSAGTDAPTLAEALCRAIGEFVLPAGPEDCAAIPPGVIITMAGHGMLEFSGTANLLAVTNPLATAMLVSPLPVLSITQGGSINVGAAWQVSSAYQVRVRNEGPARIRMGWYRKHDSEFTVTASAIAGVSAGTSTRDLFPALIRAVSSDAAADAAELTKAGVPDDQAGAFEAAVAGAVNRKLELSVAAALGSLGADEAVFLFDVDLAALDDAGKKAVHAALGGVLTGLADIASLPAGIAGVHSILSKARSSSISLKVNLLGIYNYGSISKLALKGTVMFTPSTGEVVITDAATASRIASASVNFGPDEEKLRHLMAESFLITAAYRGSRTVISPPDLTSSHLFFDMENNLNRDDLRRDAAIFAALNLAGPAIPDGIQDFGRTSMIAEARYDDALSYSLFLGPDGKPRAHEVYETAGRRAIRLLVLPDGDDRFRLQPATDDALWDRMKDLGPANFEQLLPAMQANGVRPDYLVIQWWADSMCSTGAVLERMNTLFATEQGVNPESPAFVKLRNELSAHLRDVAAKAHELFGTPWGLVAMFLASNSAAKTAASIRGQRIAYTAERALNPAHHA